VDLSERLCGLCCVLFVLIFVTIAPASFATDWYLETFDDDNANWTYWDGSVNQPSEWSSDYGDPGGGIRATGYQGNGTGESLGVCWPFSLNVWGESMEDYQEVDFSGDGKGSYVSADFLVESGSNCYGGTLHFYMGAWSGSDYDYFYHNDAFTPGDDDWISTTISIDSADEWTHWAGDGSLADEVTDIWVEPIDYGFIVEGYTQDPDGHMRMDNFETGQQPEPATLALVLAGLGVVIARRKMQS
jgi:hypothetical protein